MWVEAGYPNQICSGFVALVLLFVSVGLCPLFLSLSALQLPVAPGLPSIVELLTLSQEASKPKLWLRTTATKRKQWVMMTRGTLLQGIEISKTCCFRRSAAFLGSRSGMLQRDCWAFSIP